MTKFDEPFSSSELECALNGLKDSSPGEDGIPYSFIIKLNQSSKSFFLKLINDIFISGQIPTRWKTQVVIPIKKPGKDANDPSSYRPIALSSTLCKIMEHLVKNRLEWFVESKHILSTSQFGFRKGKSTMDSLAIFTSDIRLSYSNDETLVGVFLDVASAYDNVLLPLLRQKMYQLSIPVRIIHFVCNLFMGRSVKFLHRGNISAPRYVWNGLPQGSVLSPLLYSIYTYDLDLSTNSFCNVLQYADDLTLYFSSKSVEEISYRLNSAIYYLSVCLVTK